MKNTPITEELAQILGDVGQDSGQIPVHFVLSHTLAIFLEGGGGWLIRTK